MEDAHDRVTRELGIFESEQWGLREQRVPLGGGSKKYEEATCGACWRPGDDENRIVAGIMNGYAVETLWAICASCSEEAQKALGPIPNAQ
jgi:hypothetical protein